MHLVGWLTLLGVLARPGGATAFHVVAKPDVDAPLTWTAEPLVVVALLLSAGLYAAGARGRPSRATAAFAAGWLALVVALVSPLDALGSWLFSAHMAQHEALMLVAAPLLVLGRPGAVVLRGLPSAWRRAIGAALRPRRPLRRVWRAATEPRIAWTLHTVALWLWHVPALFDATLRSTAVHALQHASFLGTALLFWWSLLARRPGPGVALASLFTMSMQSGLLGALLTIADRPWYPAYFATTDRFGLTPLEDQQLGGLVMWVPGSIVYVAAALALLTPSLRDRRATAPIARMVAPCLLVLLLAGCARERMDRATQATGGDPAHGAVVIRTYGCASCHVIPGVAGADAIVGPPLDRFAGRAYVAGVVPNTADNLVRWIRSPHTVDAATAMPETGLSEQDARDVAAYLYTLG